MKKKILVIGHPLAAEENQRPFYSELIEYHLCLPNFWKSPGLNKEYHNSSDLQKNLYTLPIRLSGKNSWFFWKGLTKLVSEIKPDGIYCWEEPWCIASLQLAHIARRKNIPFCFYSAENKPKKLPWPFTSIRSKVYKISRAAISITPEVTQQLRTFNFLSDCEEIPLWIGDFKKHNPNYNNPTLAYIGRLIPLKRVGLLLKALPAFPKWRLKIIGDGPEQNNLKRLAKSLGLGARVIFTGHCENTQLSVHLQDVSLVVLPTDENTQQAEQFGKAAMESIAMGLPVLTSASGNYSILAKKILTLFAVTINNEKDLSKGIRKIFETYPTPAQLETSRQWVEDRFSIKAVRQKFEHFFLNKLLTEKSKN